jgi:hypothetical protein
MNERMWSIGALIMTGKTQSEWTEPYRSDTHTEWLGLKPGLCSSRPTTNCLT